jgi:hypothetical protein
MPKSKVAAFLFFLMLLLATFIGSVKVREDHKNHWEKKEANLLYGGWG